MIAKNNDSIPQYSGIIFLRAKTPKTIVNILTVNVKIRNFFIHTSTAGQYQIPAHASY